MNEDQIKTWPSVIFLQHGGAKDESEYPGRDDVTWCDHAINESDIEYVRADRFQDAWKLASGALKKNIEAGEMVERVFLKLPDSVFKRISPELNAILDGLEQARVAYKTLTEEL